MAQSTRNAEVDFKTLTSRSATSVSGRFRLMTFAAHDSTEDSSCRFGDSPCTFATKPCPTAKSVADESARLECTRQCAQFPTPHFQPCLWQLIDASKEKFLSVPQMGCTFRHTTAILCMSTDAVAFSVAAHQRCNHDQPALLKSIRSLR